MKFTQQARRTWSMGYDETNINANDKSPTSNQDFSASSYASSETEDDYNGNSPPEATNMDDLFGGLDMPKEHGVYTSDDDIYKYLMSAGPNSLASVPLGTSTAFFYQPASANSNTTTKAYAGTILVLNDAAQYVDDPDLSEEENEAAKKAFDKNQTKQNNAAINNVIMKIEVK